MVTNAAVIEVEGTVDWARAGTFDWSTAVTNQRLSPGDRLRTGERSRAVVRFSPLATLRMGELGLIEVPKPEAEDSGFSFRRGLFYFFHRDNLRLPATGLFATDQPTSQKK